MTIFVNPTMNTRNPTTTNKRKQQLPHKQSQRKPPRKWQTFFLIRPFYTAFRKTIFFLVTTLGLVGGIYALPPRIDMSAHQTIDPGVTFSAPFQVSNRGNIPIYDVRIKYLILQTKELRKSGKELRKSGVEFRDNKIIFERPLAQKLGPNKEATASCPLYRVIGPTSQLAHSTIKVKVIYKYLWVVPGRKTFKFKTLINRHGQVYWLPIWY
jgi:hypothetical protein